MTTDASASLQPGWCLRFVGGPMRGRTLTLKPGVNVLGSAGGCDIMLPGSEVQPRHLQFTVGALAVAMHRIGDAAVRLNGAAVEVERRGVVAGDRLALGRVEFEIDRVYAVEESADSMFMPKPAANDAAAAPAPAAAQRRMARALPLFAIVFATAVLLLWAGLGTPGSAASRKPDSDLGALRQALADYPEVELVVAAGGQIQLNGFVESQLRKQALDQLLQPHGNKVVSRVQVVEAVVDQARRFIGDPGVAVSYAGQGQLVLSGASEGAGVQAKIQRLAEDLHPAVLVSDKVKYRPKKQEDGAEAQSLSSNWQTLLPSRVVSITEDEEGQRHIQLANGSRYYEGSMLKSGAELKRATPDEVVIAPGAVP